MFYTEPRYTKDLDVWVNPTAENAARVHRAPARFGAPLADLSVGDLAVRGTIFQIGIAPNRIDVVTSMDGVEFDAAWPSRAGSTYGTVPIAIIGLDDLLVNKRTVGRPQDQIDVAKLERGRR